MGARRMPAWPSLLGGLMAVMAADAAPPAAGVDTFGLTRFHATLPGSREWNSAHWANGAGRTIRYSRDEADPTDWTEDHSGATDGFVIDGNGVMRMTGDAPRFHVNSLRTTKVAAQFFLNTEFTAYYRRIGNDGQAWGGMVVGVRSHPLGHASGGGDDCDATTYYARFRHDGKWDFEKELKHPASDYWSGSGFHTQDPLWGGRPLPENRWIGMKYIVRNFDGDSKVRLELWIDSTTGGEGSGGGAWAKVGEAVDAGNWPAAPGPIAGCAYSDPKTVITRGHGTVLWRTDGDEAEYKMISIREIAGEGAVSIRMMPGTFGRPVEAADDPLGRSRDLLGRLVPAGLPKILNMAPPAAYPRFPGSR